MNRNLLITLVVVLVVCICLVVAGTGALVLQSQPAVENIIAGFAPSPTAVLGPKTTAVPVSPLGSVPEATEIALEEAEIPRRELSQIVPRLKKDLTLLTPVPTSAPRTRQVGDKDSFFVLEDAATGKYRQVTATLKAIVPTAYFWVEDGMSFDAAAMQKSAEFFDQKVYPTDHQYFGSERSPGPDGDTHIHVLNTHFEGGAAGYYSSEDSWPRALAPYSNARNMIYMNINALRFGTDEYNADLAHEFQHLIHNAESQNKAGWIDEGMGDLAIKVNGFQVGGVLQLFGRNPNTQLNTWSDSPQSSLAHYAASYLFFDYTAGRFGPQFTRDVIHAPREGIRGIQAVLDQRNPKIQFDDLFADWAVTNYLNNPGVENGRYAYTNEQAFHIEREPIISQYPVTRSQNVREYAASYFALQPAGGDVTVVFTGTTTAKLLPVNAHGGRWMWYSNRADQADTSLTREVDLTRVNKATLQFWTWYDIEKDFDYAYVEVSTDRGKTWDILTGKFTTTENPNGASYGMAYTGRSGATGDNGAAQWVQEQIDLSAFAGKAVLLRFEYITDDAYNTPSWAIDDISIPEINLSDSVEDGNQGWQAEGFIRTDNVLPQHFIVQLVQQGDKTTVTRMGLDSENRGTLAISGFGKGVSRAELIVTAFAPTTTETTAYQFGVVPR